MRTQRQQPKNKISPEFASRLDRLRASDTVRAVLLLNTGNTRRLARRRRSESGRQATIRSARREASRAALHVDTVLEKFGGQRLSRSPNVLGSILIETTPEGINALASSECVDAILEDQPVFPIR